MSDGATPGATDKCNASSTPRQRLGNEGATISLYTLSVAPALGGWVHANLVPMPTTFGGSSYAGGASPLALTDRFGGLS